MSGVPGRGVQGDGTMTVDEVKRFRLQPCAWQLFSSTLSPPSPDPCQPPHHHSPPALQRRDSSDSSPPWAQPARCKKQTETSAEKARKTREILSRTARASDDSDVHPAVMMVCVSLEQIEYASDCKIADGSVSSSQRMDILEGGPYGL